MKERKLKCSLISDKKQYLTEDNGNLKMLKQKVKCKLQVSKNILQNKAAKF